MEGRAPTLRWLAQLGCKHAVFQGTDRVDPDGKGYWTLEYVLRQKKNVDDAGIVLQLMIPIGFYLQARLTVSLAGRSRGPMEPRNMRPHRLQRWESSQVGCGQVFGESGSALLVSYR